MPNWTSNRIYVEGDPVDLRSFLEAVKWEDQLFDFNRLIPMPEILKHTGSGGQTIDGKDVTSWYIVKPQQPDSPEEVRLFTPEEEAELTSIGHRNWYDWSCANWNTKWNAREVAVEDGFIESGTVEITLDTAWDAPVPVFRKMVQMFPKLSFDCRWRHEGDDPYPHSLDSDDDEAA